jgi:hypothetical protein
VPRGTQDHCQKSDTLSHTGLSPAMVRLSSSVLLASRLVTSWRLRSAPWQVLQPLCCNAHGLDTTQVWAVPLSLATTRRMLSFPRVTEMFQFTHLPLLRLWIQRRVLRVHLSGFPHSGISGSTPADGSPKLIAVNRALHRLLTPRHPPCALSSLFTRDL